MNNIYNAAVLNTLVSPKLQECIDSQSASIKSPDLYILRGRTYCLLIKARLWQQNVSFPLGDCPQ